MATLILSIVALIGSIAIWLMSKNFTNKDAKQMTRGISGGLVGFAVVSMVIACIQTVPAGHVKVATLFGKVESQAYKEGLHVVNPLMKFTTFDLRQKNTHGKSGDTG